MSRVSPARDCNFPRDGSHGLEEEWVSSSYGVAPVSAMGSQGFQYSLESDSYVLEGFADEEKWA